MVCAVLKRPVTVRPSLVDACLSAAWRGVHVHAPAGAVWPWIAQVRLAPYSYDWIDNRGRRSPRELAGLPEPRAGERFTTAGGRGLGRIVSVDPGRQLTGTIMGAYMSYVLVPQDDGTTRLLLKVTTRLPRWAVPALSVGDLVMARRQLLNLTQLAERHHRRGTAPGLARQPRRRLRPVRSERVVADLAKQHRVLRGQHRLDGLPGIRAEVATNTQSMRW